MYTNTQLQSRAHNAIQLCNFLMSCSGFYWNDGGWIHLLRTPVQTERNADLFTRRSQSDDTSALSQLEACATQTLPGETQCN